MCHGPTWLSLVGREQEPCDVGFTSTGGVMSAGLHRGGRSMGSGWTSPARERSRSSGALQEGGRSRAAPSTKERSDTIWASEREEDKETRMWWWRRMQMNTKREGFELRDGCDTGGSVIPSFVGVGAKNR